MELTINQLLKKGINFLNKVNFNKAENFFRIILKSQPQHFEAYYFLGIILNELNKLDEAEANYQNAIKFKPDFAEAYYNLAVTLVKSKKLEEGIKNYQNAIKFKPDFAIAHNNLGNVLNKLERLNEAEVSYQNAIKFKPDFAEAYYNLGNVYRDIGKLNDSELNYKKAISLKQDYVEAITNIKIIFKLKKLLSNVEKASEEKIKNPSNLKIINSVIQLAPNPFITNRLVENSLINYLDKISFRKLDETTDARFGNGKCSLDFNLFEENNTIIKKISKDLTNIMCEAVGSKVHIIDSFFNILGAGGGSKPHNHLIPFDKMNAIGTQKYSLVYYLSIGDQDCEEPGILKLYDPDKEILPSEGMVIILPSSRRHSAIYNGTKNRIMIGANFYSL